jgi:acetyl esterase/lipase
MHLTRRTLMASSLTLAATAPLLGALPALAKTAPVRTTPLNLVHPELRPLLPQLEKYGAMMPPLTLKNLDKLRKPNPLFNRAPSTDVPWERRVIPVSKPHPDVAIYIVNAKPGASRPAILHTHGGGYVLGGAESAIYDLQQLCKTLDCVAVSVDYRLAPETTYAGSIEDNYAGLKWLHANAASIGADPAKIAVMGESAGGGHAALLAITARDRGEVPLCFQCLIYPMLDDRTGTTRPVPAHVGIIIWDPEKNRFGWESFLGVKAGGLTAPKNAVPARVTNLKGLPPTFIGVGTLDLFLDEDIDYAQRLSAAGVLTELNVVPGAFHGFDMIGAALPVGKIFNTAKINALRRGFGMAAVT